MRQWSGALVTADRLTPEMEELIRKVELASDANAQMLLVAVQSQTDEVNEMAVLLGLNQI